VREAEAFVSLISDFGGCFDPLRSMLVVVVAVVTIVLTATFIIRRPWGPIGRACFQTLRRSSRGSLGKRANSVSGELWEVGESIACQAGLIVLVRLWSMEFVEG
jgi:branched-subunit amino acid ABC-type transport system permease component